MTIMTSLRSAITSIAILASVGTFAVTAVAPAFAARTQTNELDVWTHVDARILHRLDEVVVTDDKGAIGNNRTTFLQVGLQNQSSYIVPGALVNHDVAALGRAFPIMEFGFAHQAEAGNFEWRAGDSGSAPTPLSRAGSAAFFLADVGQSLVLLEQSTWYKQSPNTAALRAREAALLPHVRRAIDWLLTRQAVLDGDRAAINRTFVYALAYALPGQVIGSSAAVTAGTTFARNALDRQSSDGTFPESGGFDSSYQGVSLYLAEVFYTETSDDGIREDLWRSINRAAVRERRAVDPDGTVSTEHNSRISAQGEQLFHKTKNVDGRAVTLGLLFNAILNGDSNAKSGAMAVAHRYHVDGT